MDHKISAIGIDLGGTNIKSCIADKQGRILIFRSIASPVKMGSKAILDAIAKSALDLLEYAEKKHLNIVGVGIGSPGGIDFKTGIVRGTTPNIPDWEGVNLKKSISSQIGLPVYTDNDANLFMLAECRFGAAKGFSHAVGLTIGTGIGGGLLINGEIYRGGSSVGAEIGHIPIVANGKQCKCGLKGCFEIYASAPALLRIYRGLDKSASKNIEVENIFALAKTGNKTANQAIDTWCGYLSTGIASAVNLLNPEVVILGGGVAESGEFLKRKVEQSLKSRILPLMGRNLKIKIAKLGNKAGCLGAATVALDSIKK